MPLLEPKGQILEKYGAYVKSLAGQVRRQFNGAYEMDELISWGQVGLLEAAERFDSKVGANFLTFAHYRIKGAIYDGLRKMGVLKGNSSAAERTNAYMGNLNDREVGGGSMSDDVREISGAVQGLAMLFAAADGADGVDISDMSMPADERLQLEQLKIRVRDAIAKLPENEKKLLEGYYFEGLTLEEAGAKIGQSKSWASRLHARAVERLKQLIDDSNDNSAATPLRRNNHGGTPGRNLSSTSRPAEAPRSGSTGQQSGSQQVRPVDEVTRR